VATFLLHGANFLSLKLTGDLQKRAQSLAGKLWLAVVVLVAILLIATYLVTDLYARLGIASAIVPLAAMVALLLAGIFIGRQREGWAFVLVGLAVVLLLATFFIILFPRVMISSTNPDYSLTIYNASSSPYTLKVMSIVALIFVPIVLAYQIWSYWIFRQRVKVDPKTLTY
jgi:cytochrome d ubiquinol oxidase subunit II